MLNCQPRSDWRSKAQSCRQAKRVVTQDERCSSHAARVANARSHKRNSTAYDAIRRRASLLNWRERRFYEQVTGVKIWIVVFPTSGSLLCYCAGLCCSALLSAEFYTHSDELLGNELGVWLLRGPETMEQNGGLTSHCNYGLVSGLLAASRAR